MKTLNVDSFKDQFPEAVEAICKGYNVLFSVESEEEIVKLAHYVHYIYAEGGFVTRGWLSNSKKVVDSIGEHRTYQKKLNQNGE